MPHIFISYAKNDTRDLALALAGALDSIDGITAWVDRSLRAGRSWELQIQAEIDRCDTMVVLYSPDINRHKHGEPESFVLTEIAYAKWTAKKPIVPVMAQKTDPPISLTMEHYIDYTLDGVKLDDLVVAICEEMNFTGETVEAGKTPIERAWSFKGKRNRHWQPFVTTFPDLALPDMPFCLVPVGEFEMGGQYRSEQPVHHQTIEKPYWIAQYPVTNAQWKQAVRAGAAQNPYDVGDALKWYHDPGMSDAPVVGVDWYMARYYAAWLGCRLPTELEWEYAARGVESLRYPWGHEWDPRIPIWEQNSQGQPARVTHQPEGRSWVDAWHMSGNVWEWTSSEFAPYPFKKKRVHEGKPGGNQDIHRVLRGGSWWFSNQLTLRSAFRLNSSPADWNNFRGFRLARSLDK